MCFFEQVFVFCLAWVFHEFHAHAVLPVQVVEIGKIGYVRKLQYARPHLRPGQRVFIEALRNAVLVLEVDIHKRYHAQNGEFDQSLQFFKPRAQYLGIAPEFIDDNGFDAVSFLFF